MRLAYTKLGPVRFTSHLDVARIWERAVRHAGLPVAYSEGHSPRPRMHFGLALPTGYESLAEFLDVDLVTPADPLDVQHLCGRVSRVLPDGMDVTAAVVVGREAGALQAVVEAGEYVVRVRGGGVDAEELATRLLAAETLVTIVTKKGRPVEVDLRPGVLDAAASPAQGEWPEIWQGAQALWLRVAARPAHVRPSDVLGGLGIAMRDSLIRRTAQVAAAGTDPSGLLGPLPGARVAAGSTAGGR